MSLLINPYRFSTPGGAGIQRVAERASVGDTTASVQTLIDMPDAGSIAVGDYLFANIAADNAGAGGSPPILGLTDPRGNAWTQFIGLLRDPGAVNAGCYLWAAYCKVTNPYTNGDDLTMTSDVAVTADAITVSQWTGLHPTNPLSQNQTGHTATGSTANPSVSITPTAAGHLIYGLLAVESRAPGFVGDSDTTDGPWIALASQVADTGSNTGSMCIQGQAKVVTGTSLQTWNPTLTAGLDWAMAAVEFAPAP